jgi:hypothetical protein
MGAAETGVAGCIAGWEPSSASAEAAAFARTGPGSAIRALCTSVR